MLHSVLLPRPLRLLLGQQLRRAQALVHLVLLHPLVVRRQLLPSEELLLSLLGLLPQRRPLPRSEVEHSEVEVEHSEPRLMLLLLPRL